MWSWVSGRLWSEDQEELLDQEERHELEEQPEGGRRGSRSPLIVVGVFGHIASWKCCVYHHNRGQKKESKKIREPLLF